MKHPDYDRAFHQTPDYIRSAIELGFMKGKKRMRARRRVAGALTAVAALVLLLSAGIYGASRLATNRPDDCIGGSRGPNVLSAGGRGGQPEPNPVPEITAAPEDTATPTPPPAASEPRAQEATPAPVAHNQVAREALAAATPEPTPEAPAPGVEPTPAPTAFDSASEGDEGAVEAALPLAEEVNPESTPTPEAPTPGIDPTPAPAAHESAGEEAVPLTADVEPTLTPGVDATPASELPLVRLSAYADVGANPYFHLENPCGGAELPQEMNLALALGQGLAPCPDCVEGKGYRPLMFRADGTGDVAIRYALWYTESGSYFHVDANCSGMASAREHGIAEAFASGKRSCPVCMENWVCAVALDAPGSEPALIHALGEAQAEYLPEGASIAVEPAPATEIYEAAEVAPAAEAALDAVYYVEEGSYFHGEADCPTLRAEEGGDSPAEGSGVGVVVIGGSLMDALRAGKDACPDCLAGWDFVVNAVPTGESAAEEESEEAAPKASEDWEMEIAAVRAESIEEEIATVYAAAGAASLYHRSEACGGEVLPRALSVEQALTEGLAPCPDCLPAEECSLIAYFENDGSQVSTEGFWYTEGGRYYHSSMYCDGMWGATVHAIADAFASGKEACPRCMDGWTFAVRRAAVGASAAPEPTPPPVEAALSTPARFAMVEATPAPGEASHETASAPPVEYVITDGSKAGAELNGGMLAISEAAQSAEEEIAEGDGAPYDISHRFYYTPKGQYYHMRSDCSGMTGAKRHSAAETAASGKRHCPVCIGDRIEFYWLPAPQEDGDYDVPKLYDAAKDSWMPVVWSDAGNVFVPLNPDGGQPNYYHVNPECFGMGGAKMILWDEAKASGLGPCPACLPVWNSGGSQTICYASDGDSLYHADPNCSGIPWTRELTELAAQAEGRLRCPLCASAPAAWTEVRSELGASIAAAYPGWSFERADEFDDRTEWFISNGREALRAAIFRFAEDGEASENPVLELTLEHGDTATRFFPQSFIESLPAPLDAIQSAAAPKSIFTLRLEYSHGQPTAFTAGETTGKETKYTNWTILPNGTTKTIPQN